MQNIPIKKIFVCEFITGGGLNHDELDSSLMNEGLLMRNALLNDLALLPYKILTTLDARLATMVDGNKGQLIATEEDVWQCWDNLIQQVDAVWIVAPETNGYLEKLTSIAIKYNKIIIGCGLTTIRVCRSKFSSYHFFKAHHFDTIETYLYANWDKALSTKWIVKPDDGAGCEDTLLFEDNDALSEWMCKNNKKHTHVIQPYIEGCSASISCVVYRGHATVLSCNQQLVSINNNILNYNGFIVNGMQNLWEPFAKLANQVAKRFPDMAGYVGIDVMVQQKMNKIQIKIIEINPRLTTCYVALKQAMELNPAKIIIDTFTQNCAAMSEMKQNEVLLEFKHA